MSRLNGLICVGTPSLAILSDPPILKMLDTRVFAGTVALAGNNHLLTKSLSKSTVDRRTEYVESTILFLLVAYYMPYAT
jgi:hypothetical protein